MGKTVVNENDTITYFIDSEELSLKKMQNLVEGYIEVAYDDGEMQIVCKEEGKLKELPINDEATMLWHEKLGKFNSNPNFTCQDVLVGDVLVLTERGIMK